MIHKFIHSPTFPEHLSGRDSAGDTAVSRAAPGPAFMELSVQGRRGTQLTRQ